MSYWSEGDVAMGRWFVEFRWIPRLEWVVKVDQGQLHDTLVRKAHWFGGIPYAWLINAQWYGWVT